MVSCNFSSLPQKLGSKTDVGVKAAEYFLLILKPQTKSGPRIETADSFPVSVLAKVCDLVDIVFQINAIVEQGEGMASSYTILPTDFSTRPHSLILPVNTYLP